MWLSDTTNAYIYEFILAFSFVIDFLKSLIFLYSYFSISIQRGGIIYISSNILHKYYVCTVDVLWDVFTDWLLELWYDRCGDLDRDRLRTCYFIFAFLYGDRGLYILSNWELERMNYTLAIELCWINKINLDKINRYKFTK